MADLHNSPIRFMALSFRLHRTLALLERGVDPADRFLRHCSSRRSLRPTGATEVARLVTQKPQNDLTLARHRPSPAKSQRAWAKPCGRAKLARIYHRPINSNFRSVMFRSSLDTSANSVSKEIGSDSNTAIYSRGGPGGGSVGIGFAIPSVMVRSVVEAAVSGQELVRPWLGVSGQTVDARMAAMMGLPRPIGVLVSGLHPESPLAEAGLATGDLILALDGGGIEDYQALRFRIATRKVGASVSLTIGRQGLLGW